MFKKIYVEVIVKYTLDGEKKPLCILWEDGRRFVIDKLLEKKERPSLKTGGRGMRYTCRISGKDTFLWYDTDGKWYVEVRDKS